MLGNLYGKEGMGFKNISEIRLESLGDDWMLEMKEEEIRMTSDSWLERRLVGTIPLGHSRGV